MVVQKWIPAFAGMTEVGVRDAWIPACCLPEKFHVKHGAFLPGRRVLKKQAVDGCITN